MLRLRIYKILHPGRIAVNLPERFGFPGTNRNA